MAMAKINPIKCLGEQKCQAALSCPIKAISLSNGLVVVNEKRCLGCGKCIRFCSARAINLV